MERIQVDDFVFVRKDKHKAVRIIVEDNYHTPNGEPCCICSNLTLPIKMSGLRLLKQNELLVSEIADLAYRLNSYVTYHHDYGLLLSQKPMIGRFLNWYESDGESFPKMRIHHIKCPNWFYDRLIQISPGGDYLDAFGFRIDVTTGKRLSNVKG